jgi:hypothetical protein
MGIHLETKRATICPSGCGTFVESSWSFCPDCGRQKRKTDKSAPSLEDATENCPVSALTIADAVTLAQSFVQLHDAGRRFSKAVREKAAEFEASAAGVRGYDHAVLLSGDMYDFELACDDFDALLELGNPMGGMEDRQGCAIAVDEPVPR